jgi:hypothetical protein
VRKIQRIPFRTSLGSRQGRPLPSTRRGGDRDKRLQNLPLLVGEIYVQFDYLGLLSLVKLQDVASEPDTVAVEPIADG